MSSNWSMLFQFRYKLARVGYWHNYIFDSIEVNQEVKTANDIYYGENGQRGSMYIMSLLQYKHSGSQEKKG